MIVVDAGVLANFLGDDGAPGNRARARLAAAGRASIPELADVEATAVLRKWWLAGRLTIARFRAAVGDLLVVPAERYRNAPLMVRAYELRSNVTPYDASYVALAEALGCPLVTGDRRLAGASGIRCAIEVLTV
jgi:predicted nucleic acid-binding protein